MFPRILCSVPFLVIGLLLFSLLFDIQTTLLCRIPYADPLSIIPFSLGPIGFQCITTQKPLDWGYGSKRWPLSGWIRLVVSKELYPEHFKEFRISPSFWLWLLWHSSTTCHSANISLLPWVLVKPPQSSPLDQLGANTLYKAFLPLSSATHTPLRPVLYTGSNHKGMWGWEITGWE